MSSEKEKPHPLDKIFHPKSIAIVGASANEQERSWLARQINFGYRGQLYPVNPKATEINGLKAYPTVRDIPSPVDYAIFNIPARLVPQAMEDCVVKGVKAVHIYTANFSETGTKEGRQLQAHVAAIAKDGGVRVIGPNCMGIYYPAVGLTFSPGFSKEPGTVAFVSQSGTQATRFVHLANKRGIHFSKVVSYGNAIDLDAPDFMEYLANDKETEIITAYIEGVSDGRRFLDAVRKCLITKPVVILKAGLTEGGAGAAASHTAVLAGSESVWNTFFKQTGTISVDTPEELADMALTLLHVPYPRGRRVGIVGRGGGIGVIAADTCERIGLQVPPFLPETRRQLEQLISQAGSGSRNPVETPSRISSVADFYTEGLKIVEADPQIDFILTHMAVDIYGKYDSDLKQSVMKAVEVLANTAPSINKPLVSVLYPGENLETISAVYEAQDRLLQTGIPVYPTIEAAARAMSKLIDYHEFVKKGTA